MAGVDELSLLNMIPFKENVSVEFSGGVLIVDVGARPSYHPHTLSSTP